jgi:hypothetical protein
MVLELETEVMRDIGLGNHYNWFNGSGSCRWIRQEAARKLLDAIKKRHEKGESIAEPDEELCATLTRIAQTSDTSEYSLTKTWKAASYVIAEHIHQATATPEKRKEAYARMLKYLQEHYLVGRRENFSSLDCR